MHAIGAPGRGESSPWVLTHISDVSAWRAARDAGGPYVPDSYEVEGFIHLSTPEQLPATAVRHFGGRSDTDLVVLLIDPELIASPIVWERLGSATEDYPHLYGPLPLIAVIEAVPLERDGAGGFRPIRFG